MWLATLLAIYIRQLISSSGEERDNVKYLTKTIAYSSLFEIILKKKQTKVCFY